MMTTGSEIEAPAATLPAKRVIMPRSDWLASIPGKPVLVVCMNVPCSHQVSESDGSTTKPSATVAQKLPPLRMPP